MNHCVSILAVIFLFICIFGIGVSVGSYNLAKVTLDGHIYAEVGVIYSRVKFSGKTTTVTLNNYQLATNSTVGDWGGPWFVSTSFHTYMVLATSVLFTALVSTCVQLGLVFHKMRNEKYSKTPLTLMTAVSFVMLVTASVAISNIFELKLSGVTPTADWGIAGVSSAAGSQFFVAILLCFM
jgi:hypothetical protein